MCAHEEINEVSGIESVCLLCGLVLENLLSSSAVTSDLSPSSTCNEIDANIYSFMRDVYSRGSIADGTMRQAIAKYRAMAEQCRGEEKKKQLASFAIYATLIEANVPRTMREIEHLSGIPVHKMWRIEKKGKKNVQDCSENFVERICETMLIPYKDTLAIKFIVAQVSGVSGCRASTLIASVIWLYANEVICSFASLHEICVACNVTRSSVRKFIQKINPMYRDNICILLEK